MNRCIERRFNSTQVRMASSGGNIIVGYASVFNSLSNDLGNFKERVAPGAFSASLRTNPDVKCLLNHDPSLLVGRSKSGTLRLREDNVGLRMECDVADTSIGRDLITLVKRGDISEMSFAFTTDADDWSEEDDPETDERVAVRTLRAVSLMDVSCVTWPAYSATSVASVDPSVQALGRHNLVPLEVRSRIPNVRSVRATTVVERRKKLTNFILGL